MEGNELFPISVGIEWSKVKPMFRHINDLLGTQCFVDMMATKIYPNAKEYTESCAAFDVVRNKMPKFDLKDPNVTVLCVGDGSTPRTGAMFAFRTKWNVISIDPGMHYPAPWPMEIERLTLMRHKIEDVGPWHYYGKLVIAAVHSHAPLDVACQRFTADKRMVIAIPCCLKQERERAPDLEYVDMGIWSPKNTVKVWWDE